MRWRERKIQQIKDLYLACARWEKPITARQWSRGWTDRLFNKQCHASIHKNAIPRLSHAKRASATFAADSLPCWCPSTKWQERKISQYIRMIERDELEESKELSRHARDKNSFSCQFPEDIAVKETIDHSPKFTLQNWHLNWRRWIMCYALRKSTSIITNAIARPNPIKNFFMRVTCQRLHREGGDNSNRYDQVG